MPRMLEVADALGVPLGVTPCDGCARIGRTVVDEQQFPSPKSLGKHTLDRFVEEVLGVLEDDDDRDLRWRRRLRWPGIRVLRHV